MPPAPDHFLRCSDINRHGPNLLSSIAPLEELKPHEFKEAISGLDAVVVDIRSYSAYGGMNIGRSYNIELCGNFSTFGGWVLPTDRDIYFVGDKYDETVEAALWLRRVGMDRVKGSLAGGMPPG
ncbi:MAG: rhodanese-like domain-containing protein [Bacillota bacterium]|nr:rhodanese-like domain-containing protein [Bacillota bacterium]